MKIKLLFRSLELILRVFCALIVLSLLVKYSQLKQFPIIELYEFAAGLFYLFLLVISILLLRRAANGEFILLKTEKHLRYLKWIFVLETLFLLSIKLININHAIRNNKFKPIDFAATIIPNLGFIIFTILTFFIAALLKERNRLKEENNLTI